jgi:HNH endonuclease
MVNTDQKKTRTGQHNPYPRVWVAGRAVAAHRLVAATILERDLEPGEVVHHINGDKTDNRPENLRVLPSQRHHMTLEHLERRQVQGIESLFSTDVILNKLEV